MSEEPACLILMKTDFAPEVSIGAVLCGMKSPKTGLIGNGEGFVFRVECEVESWFWHNGKPTQFAHFSPGNLNIGNGALMLNDDFKNWNGDKSYSKLCNLSEISSFIYANSDFYPRIARRAPAMSFHLQIY